MKMELHCMTGREGEEKEKEERDGERERDVMWP